MARKQAQGKPASESMAESPTEPAQAVVMAVSIIALLFGIVQIGTGSIFGILPILIGIIGVIYLDVGTERISEWFNRQNSTTSDTTQEESTENALAVLRERYARGEISREEFEQRLEDLLETETVKDAVDHRSKEPLTEQSR